MNSPVSFLTNLRQDRLQRSEMFSWNKIINALKRSRGNINPFTTFKPSGWKCYKTIGSYVSCAFIEIWSTWEVWRALKKLELLSTTPRATLAHFSCSPNFLRASCLNERTLTYEPIVKSCRRHVPHTKQKPAASYIVMGTLYPKTKMIQEYSK